MDASPTTPKPRMASAWLTRIEGVPPTVLPAPRASGIIAITWPIEGLHVDRTGRTGSRTVLPTWRRLPRLGAPQPLAQPSRRPQLAVGTVGSRGRAPRMATAATSGRAAD